MARARSVLGAVAILSAGAGCMVPRSAGVGQTAAVPMSGGGEAALGAGLAYRHETAEPEGGGGSENKSDALQIPALEGNFLYGLSSALGLNMHASAAGLQPGVKLGMSSGAVNFAVLPEVGFSYLDVNSKATSPTSPDEKSSTTEFGWMAGLKLMASMPGSVYGALGYDFQRLSLKSKDSDGTTDTDATLTVHNLTLAVGFDLGIGAVRIRPELAVAYAPKVKSEDDSPDSTDTDGTSLYLFPCIWLVVASP